MADVADPGTSPRAERLRELRFCLNFALLGVAIFVVIYAAGDAFVAALNRHIARASAAVLHLMRASAVASGAVVSVSGFAVEIKNNCNAIYEFGLFTAAAGAYPTTLGAKAVGILLGATVLYVVNLVRVVSLLLLGMYAPSWFEVSHLYVWQALFFATVVACWFGWILRIRPRA
jgi:exosortase H (IPTLxxWG-CTERM-specific)